MKIERTKNTTRNIIFGSIYRVVATACPFLMRTILLYTLGVEYLGLNSLFTSLLSFLSLAELGVGSAMVYAMYKPIADEDDDKICALLNLYRQLYRIIGTIILIIGVALLPFLNNFVKGSHPADVNLYVLYGIYLFNTVISYYLFGYKQSILMAYQRTDIISKCSLVIQLAMYILQAVVLLSLRNYYYYIILLPVFTAVTNFANSYIVDKYYPQYKCKGTVDKITTKEIRKNVMALIGGKLSNTVLHSSDNLVLSTFVGLSMVAIYGNYYYIINAVVGFTEIIYTSLTAGIGNSLVTEKNEKNYNDFKLLTFMNSWLVMWCSTCIFCLMQPFMRVWVGEDLMFPISMVLMFTVYFYLYQINKIVLAYKDAAGLWWQDRFRPYVVMGTNLIINIISVQFIGVYGVIASTILSLIISIPWSTYTIFKYLFVTSPWEYICDFIKNGLLTVVIVFITFYCCSKVNINEWLNLIISGLICCVLPNIIWIVLYNRNALFKMTLQKLIRLAKRG